MSTQGDGISRPAGSGGQHGSANHHAGRHRGSSDSSPGAAADLQPPFRTPEMEALEAHLAATRLELAETIDALTERVSPVNVARRARAGAQQIARDAVSSDADPQARRRARIIVAATAAAVVLAAAVVVRRLR